jgi:hypothetical protein
MALTIARRPLAGRVGVTGAALLVLAVVHAGDAGRPSARALHAPTRATRAAPATTQAPTRVTAIYPTVNRVPANLLKVYVEFSAPMSDGEAEQRLHLYDARGHEMPRAFLHVDAELWNDTHTRLTVLFDPGRIKRGLRANLEDGAPLTEGETFRLAIDPAWRDGHGAPLATGYAKTLTVGPADRTSPNWHRWTVAAPQAGIRDPVTVRFDKPLDRALLDRWVVVVDPSSARLAGRPIVGPDQTSWSFIPDNAWRRNNYRLLVNPLLEDLAGNTLVSLFDADMEAQQRPDMQPRRDASIPIALPFTARAARLCTSMRQCSRCTITMSPRRAGCVRPRSR